MPDRPGRPAIRPPSPRLLSAFARYVRHYLARNFHAVRLLRRDGRPPVAADEGLVVYLAHPAWWDPLVALHLARTRWPERTHRAPIDAAALGRYRFFERLGFFGVDRGTVAGARRFLAASEDALSAAGGALWVTPQGRFTDPRVRPSRLEPGIVRLAERAARRGGRPLRFLPLALEYPFWEEKLPEALAAFGEPTVPAREDASDRERLELRLAERLEAAQDALAEAAVEREPAAFETLVRGGAGVGGVYDLWRGVRARMRGERFVPGHGRR